MFFKPKTNVTVVTGKYAGQHGVVTTVGFDISSHRKYALVRFHETGMFRKYPEKSLKLHVPVDNEGILNAVENIADGSWTGRYTLKDEFKKAIEVAVRAGYQLAQSKLSGT